MEYSTVICSVVIGYMCLFLVYTIAHCWFFLENRVLPHYTWVRTCTACRSSLYMHFVVLERPCNDQVTSLVFVGFFILLPYCCILLLHLIWPSHYPFMHIHEAIRELPNSAYYTLFILDLYV